MTVGQLIEETYAVANRLRSVDFVYSYDEPGHGARGMRLRERDGKIRGDAFIGIYVAEAPGDPTTIFNGKSLVGFSPKTKRLGTTDNPTEVFAMPFDDPLCATYRWMMSMPMLNWSQAKSHAKWLEKARLAELQSPTDVNGTRCDRVKIPGPNESWGIIDIADGLRIPIRWCDYDKSGIATQEVTVREWKVYPTNEGDVVLPVVVDLISRLPLNDGRVQESRTTQIVDLASVRVNPGIGEEVFSIPAASASQIYDRDKRELTIPEKGVVHQFKPDGTLVKNARQIPVKTSWQTLSILAAFIIAILAGTGIWYSQRRLTP